MIPQWHRGSDWAVAHARRFRDEVAARVREGVGAATHERLRLMWIGAGLWHDTSFYRALEEKWGAVFVWSMYMPFAGPQYIREIRNRPMEALASRICSMNEVSAPAALDEWLDGERGAAIRDRRGRDVGAAGQPAAAVRYEADC